MVEHQTTEKEKVGRRRFTAGRLFAGAALAAGGVLVVRAALRRGEPAEEATYPPLDSPKPVAEGIWIVDAGPIQVMGLPLPVRMTVIRLESGDLLLHSPTPYTAEIGARVASLGRVRHLVAPNIGHWTFLAAWQRAFPEATAWAAPGLRDRAQVRASGVRFDAELGDPAPPAWSGEIGQGVIAGAGGFREMWFFHKASRTLLLVDLIENLDPRKLPPASRLLMRAAAATGGTTARYLRPLIRFGGNETREAIAALIALEPERVIFAHGRCFTDRGTEQSRRAFAWLL